MPTTERGPDAAGDDHRFGAELPEAVFTPPRFIANAHLQSVMTKAPWRRRRVLASAGVLLAGEREHLLDCGGGVRLQGFFSRPPVAERGNVVLLHGWEGSAHSTYILSVGAELLGAGFAVFRLNFRDHGNTKSLNAGLFHSCRIDEVVSAVRKIRELSDAPFFAIVGQSLGGNFALRVAATARDLPIDRVIAVCPVLDPASTMRALDSGFWLYRRYYLNRWRRSLAEKAAAFPHLYRFGDLGRFATLTSTTRFFVEGYTEFANLDDYLAGYAVTGDVLSRLDTPARVILAEDDPVIPVGDLARIRRSDAVEVTLVRRGGHCGFVDAPFGPAWIDREIVADILRS